MAEPRGWVVESNESPSQLEQAPPVRKERTHVGIRVKDYHPPITSSTSLCHAGVVVDTRTC